MIAPPPLPAPPPRPPQQGDRFPSYPSQAAPRGGSWTGAQVAAAVVGAVVVAGLLAWSIRERVSPASTDAGGMKTLTSTVWTLRSQIALFKLQHNDQLPGVCPLVYNGGPSGADAATFWAQMTQFTDLNGNTSPTKSATFRYGPYMQSPPVNNLNGSKTIASAPAKGVGFVYDFAGGSGTGKIWGVDPSGALVGG